jgi:hypothetical protein
MSQFFRIYSNYMATHPKIGNCLTTGTCYGAGDLLAQKIEKNQGKRDKYDWHRTLTFTVFGTIFGGPIYYMWFEKLKKTPLLLEKIVKRNETNILMAKFRQEFNTALYSNKLDTLSFKQFRQNFKTNFDQFEKPVIRSKTILTTKILLDQFVFSVFYPIFFLVTSGVMLKTTKPLYESIFEKDENKKKELLKQFNMDLVNKSFDEGVTDIKNKFLDIYILDCAVWPMAQMINFSFVPAHLNPVYVNILNIGWNTFLCYTSQSH